MPILVMILSETGSELTSKLAYLAYLRSEMLHVHIIIRDELSFKVRRWLNEKKSLGPAKDRASHEKQSGILSQKQPY